MGKPLKSFTTQEIVITILLFILGIIPGIIYLVVKTRR